jgi:hypothetical protein
MEGVPRASPPSSLRSAGHRDRDAADAEGANQDDGDPPEVAGIDEDDDVLVPDKKPRDMALAEGVHGIQVPAIRRTCRIAP